MVMAEIYVICGRFEEAIDELEYFSTIEAFDKVNGFKFNPIFAPILDHPRYIELEKRHKTNWEIAPVN